MILGLRGEDKHAKRMTNTIHFAKRVEQIVKLLCDRRSSFKGLLLAILNIILWYRYAVNIYVISLYD